MNRSVSKRGIALAIILPVVIGMTSASPALAQEPALVETFNDPALPAWDHTPEVAVVDGRLRVPAPGAAFYEAEWCDLTLSVWVRRSGEGALNIYYRAGGTASYSVAIYSDRIALERYRAGRPLAPTETPFSVPEGAWFQVSVSAVGETHSVAIGGEKVLSLDAPESQVSGGIGFEAFDGAVGEFDDLIVVAEGRALLVAAPPTQAPSVEEPRIEQPVAEAPPQVTAPAGCTGSVAPGGLQSAADAAQPGDVVCVEAGDYTSEEGIRFTVSGTADEPITFTTNGEAVTVHSMILEQGVSHLCLHGFAIQGFEVWGVEVGGNNEDIVLSGLEINGGEAGVRFTYEGNTPVNNITLSDSVIRDTVYCAIDCTPGPCNNMRFQRLEVSGAGRGDTSYGADALELAMGAHVLVEDCYFHDNGGDGIDLNSRDAGPMPGIVVRRNRVLNNRLNGIKLWNGGVAVNNVVWNANGALILEPGDYTIANNTFANNNEQGYQAVLGGYDVAGPSTIRLYNNIFYNDDPVMGGTMIYFAAGVQLEADNNLYYNPYREDDVICAVFLGGDEDCFSRDQINDGTWFAQSGQGEHSIYADPSFVDAASGDFHLAADSPAVDAGSADRAPNDDLEGNARPSGGAPDLGAHER